VYELPLVLHQQGLDERVAELLNIWSRATALDRWERVVSSLKQPQCEVEIAVVGKYVHLVESYKSLHEALLHGGVAAGVRVNCRYIDAETIDSQTVADSLASADGLLVPGGFGERGHEGKVTAINFAREHGLPFFGICLGMQMAVVEIARNLAQLESADSTEFDAGCAHPVIALMDEQRHITEKGGTMRLGAYPCELVAGTRSKEVYGKATISERHRHRYEFNSAYRDKLEKTGLVVAGTSPDGALVEIVEIVDHPWFLGCQFHPEFQSKPFSPHPLFHGFVAAARDFRNARIPKSKR
jgi:CTP synthase